MNREQLQLYLEGLEQQLGLVPGEFSKGIWGQESSRSLDPTLRGPELSRGRGRAIGPFQVVPFYHPDFPVGGGLAEQADFAARLYARGGSTPEERMRRYYGTGTPPPGHPTTDEYVAQASRRAGLDYAQRKIPFAGPAMASTDYDAGGLEMPGYYDDGLPQRESSWFERGLAHPLTQLGMGILAAPGNYGDWAGALAQGMGTAQSAMAAQQKAEDELWELQQKRKDKVYERAQRERLATYYEQNGQPEMAMRIRASIGGTLPTSTYGVNPLIGTDAQGNPVALQVSSAGGATPLQLPAGVSLKGTPGYAGTTAYETAQGTARGKALVDAQMGLGKAEQQAENVISTIDTLLSPEKRSAREWATGVSGRWGGGSAPFTGAADWRAELTRLKSGLFMQAFEMLKGAGAITEKEGAAAQAALANIDLDTMTEEAVVRELERVRSIARAGIERARQQARGGSPQVDTTQQPAAQQPAAQQPASPSAPPPGADPVQWQRLQELRRKQGG